MSEAAPDGHFLGFARLNGLPGVRNHVAIVSLSGLENAAAHALHRLVPQALLIDTTYGRGHIGDDEIFQRHMTAALATHPNVGACVVLGPDEKGVAALGGALQASGRAWAGVSLQGVHEDRFTLIEQGARALVRLRHAVSRQKPTPQPLSQLAIAIECGHSDATSGLVANPLAGDLATWLVSQGGRALFSETLEWTGTGEILTRRAATPQVAAAIHEAMTRRHAMALSAGNDPQKNNPGPQNHAGGITTLEEKSLGAIAKGGEQPIVGLLREGADLPAAPGLYLMDTPCFSPESITSMIASGAQIVVFTTGQGNPYGSALAPTLKISANPKTLVRLGEQIDFDASAVLRGQVQRTALLAPLRQVLLDIASGALTWSEAAGEQTESISRLGPSI